MTSLNLHLETQSVRSELQPVYQQLNQLILGKELQIKLSLTCLLANGHLLLEDLPGMGKTVLSHSLAKVLGLDYNRVQFTNDLLPADLLGASIYQAQSQSFHFVEGPVFTQFLLADEINRATPKTQSALLEAMEERQVSLEGETRKLPNPFFVIATQNPAEQIGTAPLPESQLDRFLMRIQMGYPVKAAELEILAGESRRDLLNQVESLIDIEQLEQYQKQASGVGCSETALANLYELLQFSRESNHFTNGLSTRAGLALLNAAKAWAWLEGSEHLLPAHIQAVFPYVAGHRLQRISGACSPLENGQLILEQVAVPR
ncbi:AAA family ATPase [Neptuniibacter sp. QD72_48]|uniref:AAA family ATPase n=1 Tax=unclassified Neptuniibacter TaxID=2630693 RepID=UPI0039F4E900